MNYFAANIEHTKSARIKWLLWNRTVVFSSGLYSSRNVILWYFHLVFVEYCD